MYETNAKDQVQRSYVYSAEGQLLALNKHNGNTVSDTYTYHYNPRGDVIALTDQSGQVVASYEYDSWGNPLESKRTGIALENPFRYAGYHYDEETGLYYLMARYYHPTHGVFLSLDPDPGDDDDVLTQNGYTYANNNPVMLVDPDGEWAWAAVGGVIGGVSAYRAAKRKRKRGWRLVGATVGGAAFGAIGGRKLKIVNRAYRSIRNVYKIKKTRRIAKRLKYDSTAAKHASNKKRYVPRHHLATTVVYGKKTLDGAKGYSAYHSIMYKNRKKYRLKVVYNKRKKRVRHFHYKEYKR
ncbi:MULTISPECIES: RHS repeat domain-containing protein [unclassified Virgibacillus]|uniref:RHS repeat domain-containing protein n=1 Tax=unclassified Virgibacillus TaxID=2620237 RepID=UPI000A708190|nr:MULTISPECIES: RHS repeat-associated core domain-containing protein [unclassified Virgibacillus]MBS7428579.1 hypothetical protein [Virgibacillus sp. 19R1-5]